MGRLLTIIGASFILLGASAMPTAALAQSYDDISKALLSEAQAQVLSESYETAQRLFERALVANPASVEALLGLGMVHDRQGRIGRSLKYYRQALEIDPRNLPALKGQALAFLKRDLPDRASQNAERLIEICGQECVPASEVREAVSKYRQKLADASSAEQGL